MKRKIIEIDESRCDGCGDCVTACAEGAIAVVNGKAKLVKDIYCDGLGVCLGHCPRGAITVIERDAAAYDEEMTKKRLAAMGKPIRPHHERRPVSGGCPGSAMINFSAPAGEEKPGVGVVPPAASRLSQWPVQLTLVPPFAPFLKNRPLLLCADCVPFAVPDFHERYLAGRALLIGCPKLDDLPAYREKLAEIFREAAPPDVMVLIMEVPCCSGLARAAVEARDEVQPRLSVEVGTTRIRDGSASAEHF